MHARLGFADAMAEITCCFELGCMHAHGKGNLLSAGERGVRFFVFLLQTLRSRVTSEGGVSYGTGRDVMIWATDRTSHSHNEAVVLLYRKADCCFGFFPFFTL